MSRPTPKPSRWHVAFLCLALATACSLDARSRSLQERDAREFVGSGVGQKRFVLDDFGGLAFSTLETNALPWKVVAAALLLTEHDRDGAPVELAELPRALTRYGFIYPERIANWESGEPQPRLDLPLGLVSGEVTLGFPPLSVDAANLGCAACHAGVLYDPHGHPTREVWLGLPNTSIDLERWTHDVYASLKLARTDRERLVSTVERLYPDMGRRERNTLEQVLLPRIARRIAALERGLDAPTPFSNGGPGRTNGVAALKLVLGLIDVQRAQPEVGFTSIPDLAWRGLRSSLLVDGFYAPDPVLRFSPRESGASDAQHARELAAIVAFFTVPTMGLAPAQAEKAIPRVEDVVQWLVERYRPPPFPGPIEEAKALRGREVYVAQCAGCHGETSSGTQAVRLTSFPNRLLPVAEMHTSPARNAAVDASLVAKLAQTAVAHHAAPAITGGYVAPILSSLWATAPYLHNGSVPSLWHLMHPRERPVRFQVGGHALDFVRVGIAGETNERGDWLYPAGYVPWSRPELYDTSLPGQENSGHEREFDLLSDEQKDALLEYLKLL